MNLPQWIFATIQAAVNAAQPNNTIIVDGGDHQENLVITTEYPGFTTASLIGPSAAAATQFQQASASRPF